MKDWTGYLTRTLLQASSIMYFGKKVSHESIIANLKCVCVTYTGGCQINFKNESYWSVPQTFLREEHLMSPENIGAGDYYIAYIREEKTNSLHKGEPPSLPWVFTSSNVVYNTVDSAVSARCGQLLTQANTLLKPCSSWGSNSITHRSNLQWDKIINKM